MTTQQLQELAYLGPSRTRILTQLLSEPRSPQQIASNLKVQVSAARKHLDYLEKWGFVIPEFRRVGVGRPRKFYNLTDRGRESFPRQYDAVLNAVLSELVRREGADTAESFMSDVAVSIAKSLRTPEPGLQQKDHENELNKLDFQSKVEDGRNEFRVKSGNCPILKTAMEHRETVCRGLHEKLLVLTLGEGKISREKWIVTGDPYCSHVITRDLGTRKRTH